MNGDASNEEIRQPRRYRGDPGLRLVQPGETGAALPHSPQAEECLLAAALMDPIVVTRAKAAQLLARHFFDVRCGLIWEKICVANDRTGSTSIVLVAAELEVGGELVRIGGYEFLMQIAGRVVTTMEASRHLQIVLDFAMVRQALGEATRANSALQGWKGEELDSMLGSFALSFQRLADFALRRKRPSQREIAAAARAYAQASAAGKLDKTRSVPFGGLPHTTVSFLPFDVAEEDWFILLAAVPNGGKSTLLRQHVAHNLLHGKRFAVFLLETSRRRWLMAVAGMFAGVNLRELEDTAKLHPERMKNFDAWMECIESWMDERLWIFDDVFYLEDIERQVREINRQIRERELAAGVSEDKAHGLDGVLGDHLHLVNTRRDFRGQRDAQLSYIGSTLKILHKGIDVPGFWAAQLNRSSRVENRRPQVSELRDSGTLEQNADVVLLLHTMAENKAGQKQDGNLSTHEVELIQGKRRNGPSGVAVDLVFHRKLGSYEEVSSGATPRPGTPKPKNGYKRGGDS